MPVIALRRVTVTIGPKRIALHAVQEERRQERYRERVLTDPEFAARRRKQRRERYWKQHATDPAFAERERERRREAYRQRVLTTLSL
jgi:hypothetical protein